MNRLYALKSTFGFAFILIVATAVLVTGCDSTGAGGDGGSATNGTVAVSLSGATDLDGDLFAVYLYAHDEHSIHTAGRLLAVNYSTVDASGNANIVLKEDNGGFEPTGTNFVGTAGTTYDMYIYTDSQDNGTLGGTDDYEAATSVRAFRTSSYPQTVTIDGDQTVSISRGAMVDYEGGTVTIELTNAPDPDYDDQWFYYGIFLGGAVPGTDDALAYAEKTIASGSATSVEDDLRARFDSQTFYAVDGTSYDVYVMIDMDGSGHDSGITDGDLLHQFTFTQSGDTTNSFMTDAVMDYEVYTE